MMDFYWLRHVLPGVPLAAVFLALIVTGSAAPRTSETDSRVAVIEQRQSATEREADEMRAELKELRSMLVKQSEENALIKSRLDQIFWIAGALATFGLGQIGNFIGDRRRAAKERSAQGNTQP